MTLDNTLEFSMEAYLGCFGRYRKGDPVCRQWCALNLRCTIEHDRNERFEIIEELVSASGLAVKLQ